MPTRVMQRVSPPEPAWRQHLPWIATLVAFAYAAVKVAIISGGSVSVARGVVVAAALPTLLLGVAMLALPMLIAIVAFGSAVVTLASIYTKTPWLVLSVLRSPASACSPCLRRTKRSGRR